MAERLWAPWRFDYVTTASKPKQDGCIFVELPAQENDRENLILYRGERAFVIMNAFPYTNGHLMVAPYRHTPNIEDLDQEELYELSSLIADSVRWLKKAYGPEGFNIGANIGLAAGAGIPSHVHWHIVPRWTGDTNFMTTIGDVRVLPQALPDTYDLLKKTIGEDRK
jgi:ATP adenylyltransferase